MDLLKCEALLRAVDTGSFSAAAAQLGYTPSGIIRMVNALEAELGFPLVARSRKGVRLTPDGERILPALRNLAHWDEQIRQIGADIRGLSVGNITVASYFSVAAYWLPPIIRAFQADHPGIRINIMEGSNSEMLTWLEDRRADCCFFSEDPNYPGDWIPLKEDPLMAWLPQDHPRAKDGFFPVEELDGAPFINPFPDNETDTDRLCAQYGVTPDVRFTTRDNYTAYTMVAAGLGISVNNLLMSRELNGKVAVVPLQPPCSITLGVALPSYKEASPAARKFVDYAKRMAAEL